MDIVALVVGIAMVIAGAVLSARARKREMQSVDKRISRCPGHMKVGRHEIEHKRKASVD